MKYWAYVNNEILGPFEKEKLLELPSFSPSLLICPQTPVGEKTEDWKDASSYPEISAILSPGAPKAAAPAPQAAAPTPAPASQPLGGSGIELKSLTASSVEPVPPTSDHSFGQINLGVGHLERSDRMSPSQAAAAAAFDPISLSSIGRKADALSGGDAPAPGAAEGIAKEPHSAVGLPAHAEIPAIAPAPAAVDFPSIAPAPAMQAPQETFAPVPAAEPRQAQPIAAAPVAGGPALDELNRKIEIMAANTVSRQDLSLATDPLRMKLDQMGEVLSSMKNSQFQREIMDKLGYLENAISDIKFSMKEGTGGPATGGPAPDRAVPGPGKLTFEPNSATMFGAQPEKAKAEAAPPADKPKTFGIVDEGVKTPKLKGMISGFIRRMIQVLLTVGLLLAVLLVTVFALKVANVFDATKYIPFKIPFLSATAPGEPAQAEFQSKVSAQMDELRGTPQAGEQPEAKKEADVSPEVVYFARYYAPKPGGPKLEDKIAEVAAASGATYSPSNWTAKATSTSTYEAAATVPGKTGNETFTFAVDFAKKTITPMDDKAKTAFDALTPAAVAPKAGGKRGKKGAAAAAPAPKPKAAAAKKPAAKKTVVKPAEDEEYEYVDEEEAGQ